MPLKSNTIQIICMSVLVSAVVITIGAILSCQIGITDFYLDYTTNQPSTQVSSKTSSSSTPVVSSTSSGINYTNVNTSIL